jgi:hypothetical protein
MKKSEAVVLTLVSMAALVFAGRGCNGCYNPAGSESQLDRANGYYHGGTYYPGYYGRGIRPGNGFEDSGGSIGDSSRGLNGSDGKSGSISRGGFGSGGHSSAA